MKAVILVALSVSLLLAMTPGEREVYLEKIVDMSAKNTQEAEARISKIEIELERKAKVRLEKQKARDTQRQKLDEELSAKSKQRYE